MIRAEINNKDRYALSQAARHAFRGTPLGVRDTEESIGAVTAEYCYATLQRLLCSCPIYISFTGNYTEEKAAQIDGNEHLDHFLSAARNVRILYSAGCANDRRANERGYRYSAAMRGFP